MTYTYQSLAPSLHTTADAAIAWFIRKWGVTKSTVEVEAEIDADINFRPTFLAATTDFHVLAIEVSETIYTNALDSFVLYCQKKCLPVLLFVAVPKGLRDPEFGRKLNDAKRAGVGIIEVDGPSGNIIQYPLALILAAVRPVDTETFPRKYRQGLQKAEQSFRDGYASKGCSELYDLLEGVFRRFAHKCHKKKLWPNNSKMKIQTDPWAGLITDVDRYLNRSDPVTKKITSALLARIHGITSHRNESDHQPHSQRQLIKRDTELRTRFEAACDLLKEFLDATSPWRI